VSNAFTNQEGETYVPDGQGSYDVENSRYSRDQDEDPQPQVSPPRDTQPPEDQGDYYYGRITHYGYEKPGDADFDWYSYKGIGAHDNRLSPHSVALSPDMEANLGVRLGDKLKIELPDGRYRIVQFDDRTSHRIRGVVDLYDPDYAYGSLSGSHAKISRWDGEAGYQSPSPQVSEPSVRQAGDPTENVNYRPRAAKGSILSEIRSHPEYDSLGDVGAMELYRQAHYPEVAQDKFLTYAQEDGGKERLDKYVDRNLTPLQRFKKHNPDYSSASDDDIVKGLYEKFAKPGEEFEDFKNWMKPPSAMENFMGNVAKEAKHAAANVVPSAVKAWHETTGAEWNLFPWLSQLEQSWDGNPVVSGLNDLLRKIPGYNEVEGDFQKVTQAANSWFQKNAQAEQGAAQQTQVPYQQGIGAKVGQVAGQVVGSTPQMVGSGWTAVGTAPKAALAIGMIHDAIQGYGQAKEIGKSDPDAYANAIYQSGLRAASQKILNFNWGRIGTGAANAMLGVSSQAAQAYINGQPNPVDQIATRAIVDGAIGVLNGHEMPAHAWEEVIKAKSARDSGNADMAMGHAENALALMPEEQRKMASQQIAGLLYDAGKDPHAPEFKGLLQDAPKTPTPKAPEIPKAPEAPTLPEVKSDLPEPKPTTVPIKPREKPQQPEADDYGQKVQGAYQELSRENQNQTVSISDLLDKTGGLGRRNQNLKKLHGYLTDAFKKGEAVPYSGEPTLWTPKDKMAAIEYDGERFSKVKFTEQKQQWQQEPGDPKENGTYFYFFGNLNPIKALKGLSNVLDMTLPKVRAGVSAVVEHTPLKGFGKDWNKEFNPEALSPTTETTGALIKGLNARQKNLPGPFVRTVVENMGHVANQLQEVVNGERRDTYWKKFNDRQLLKMVSDYEKKGTTGNATADQLLKVQKAVFDHVAQLDSKMGIEYDPREHYIPHIFKNKEEADRFFAFVRSNPKRWPNPNFMKPREFEDAMQAAQAGFKMKTLNPERLMQMRLESSIRAWNKIELLDQLEKEGLAWNKKNPNAPKDIGEQWNGRTMRAPNGENYWIHPEAEFMIKRAWDPSPLHSALMSRYMGFMQAIKTTGLAMKFSFSAFHALHVTGIRAADVVSNMIDRGMSGNLRLKDVKESGKAVASMGLWTTRDDVKRVGDFIDVARGRASMKGLDSSQKMAYQLITEGGLNLAHSHEYERAWHGTLQRAVSRVPGGDPLMKYGGAILNKINVPKWFFDRAIPSNKAAAYLDQVQTLLEKNPGLMNNRAARAKALTAIAKDVERRFGMMFYDNLFWNKAVKEIGVAHALSLGWDMGMFHVIGGAVKDLSHNVAYMDEIAKTWRTKGTRAAANQFLTPKMLKSASYLTLGYLAAGTLQYVMTGLKTGQPQMPEGEDWVFPRVGKNPDGSWKRVNTMFFNREFPSLQHKIESEGAGLGGTEWIADRLNPGLMASIRLGMNRDYRGKEIVDPNANMAMRSLQFFGYMAKEAGVPISMQSMVDDPSHIDATDTALAYMGFNPAPGYANRTPLENHIMEEFNKEQPGSVKGATELDQIKSDLRKAVKNKDQAKMQETAQKLQELGAKPQHIKRMIQEQDVPIAQRFFGRLKPESQVQLLDQMSSSERQSYLPKASKRARAMYLQAHPELQ
jgi:hypothetical protein